jgi:hypothetical protein
MLNYFRQFELVALALRQTACWPIKKRGEKLVQSIIVWVVEEECNGRKEN